MTDAVLSVYANDRKIPKMKPAHYLWMLLAVITALGSCKKSDFSHENQFDRSYQAWLDFKKNSLDSYSYKVSAGSWTGVSAETVITVKSGKVAGRGYELKNINRTTNQPYTMTSWKESSDSLNTHAEGAPPLTLDDVYEKAKTQWLLKRKNVKIYFEADNAGMISSCGYTQNGCVDDCFQGVHIDYIRPL